MSRNRVVLSILFVTKLAIAEGQVAQRLVAQDALSTAVVLAIASNIARNQTVELAVQDTVAIQQNVVDQVQEDVAGFVELAV